MANPTASAPGERSADHLSLIEPGRWALWRDVGVRASGFPVRGLEVFGAGDGAERLREVARDPRFREAVTWQNRAALRNTIDRAAMDNDRDDATSRRRLEIIASYWQRYCAKNETIGFFGPMGWGHIVDGEDPIDQQPGRELLAQRTVRFEVWAIQVLADVLAEDPDVHRWIPPRRRPDRGPADRPTPRWPCIRPVTDGDHPGRWAMRASCIPLSIAGLCNGICACRSVRTPSAICGPGWSRSGTTTCASERLQRSSSSNRAVTPLLERRGMQCRSDEHSTSWMPPSCASRAGSRSERPE